MMKKMFAAFAATLLVTGAVAAQEHTHMTMDPVASRILRNEIGVSGGALYDFDHGEWGGGAHVHFFRTFTPHSRWAWGAMAGAEWMKDGNHLTLGAGVKYTLPRYHVEVAAMPGVAFARHTMEGMETHEGHDHGTDKYKVYSSMHVEVLFPMFEIGRIHLGPVFEMSFMEGDDHMMLGLHAAYAF